jgi:phenylacetic acid degradation operon negative regulatory protein
VAQNTVAGHAYVPAVPDRLLPTLTPLTARSVAISTLLGFHPPALPVRALVRVGGLFGIAERTTRVALTRMVADGDAVTDDGVYRLTDRLVRRQAVQDELTSPRTTEWDGDWEMAVVTATGRPLADRVALRKTMTGLHLAELREGVWMRPANLLRRPDDTVAEQCTVFTGRHPDPRALTETLWDLPAWAEDAGTLLSRLADTEGLADGFMLIAEVYRHLQLDPCLPDQLLPAGWPSEELRSASSRYVTAYAGRLREYAA